MSDLCYLGARIRAMRGELLSPRDYERILACPDLPGIASSLRDGPYGRFIDAVGRAASDAARLEEALRRNLQETFARLHAMSAGDCREGMRILLGGIEAQAIRTILRGKSAGQPAEEILAALVPTGIHDEAALQELCRQPGVRAVADLLATWRDPWSVPLLGALREYREPKDLFVLETALERFRFAQAAERLREMRGPRAAGDGEDALGRFLALSADRINVMTALTAVEERVAPDAVRRHFLPEGRIYGEDDLARILASRSLSEALSAAAAKSVFAEAVTGLPSLPPGVPPLSIVDRRLERCVLRALEGRMRSDPLGWALPIAYLLSKLLEAANLRMIFRGRLVDLPEPELAALLILEH